MGILRVTANKRLRTNRTRTSSMAPLDLDMMDGPLMVVEDVHSDDLGSIEVETFCKPSGSLGVSKIIVVPEKALPPPQEMAGPLETVASHGGRVLVLDSHTSASTDFYNTIATALWNPCGDYECDPRSPSKRPKSALKTSAASTLTRRDRSVSFRGLEIREYDMTLGDHPSASTGPPVQLDWEYKSHHKIDDLDEYERARLPRRSRRQLRMNYRTREKILFHEKGFTETEVLSAWNEAVKIRQQRYETFTQSLASTKMEEAWQSACRKFTRTFGTLEF